jgi:Predicted transcriptional regulators
MRDIQISLAAARVNANMTQAAVAEKLKVSTQTIVSWEKGRTEPNLQQAKRLCDLYEIPFDYIFFARKSNLI